MAFKSWWWEQSPEKQAEVKAKIRVGCEKARAEKKAAKIERDARLKEEYAKKVALMMMRNEPRKSVRMGRRDPAVERVRNALTRLSRDRWIPWEELLITTRTLLECACWGNAGAHMHRILDEGYMTGMLRGRPTFARDSSQIGAFLDFIKDPKNKKRMHFPELVIFEFKLKELS